MIADFQIRRVDWQEHGAICADLRKQVFFNEAQYHYFVALDGRDADARHVLALDAQQQPIGCGRISSDWQISRIAVLRPWRQRGIGTALLDELVAIARDAEVGEVFCAVPVFSLPYYRRQQFEAVGSVYNESDVPYQRMRLQLDKRAQRSAGQA